MSAKISKSEVAFHPLLSGVPEELLPESRFINTDLPEKDRNDILIKRFLPKVKYLASRLSLRLPKSILEEDLVSSGILGLIDAISKYDPSRGLKLGTYADFRIRGAMFDELRKSEILPRRYREKLKQIERANIHLTKILGREPDEEEVAGHLGVTVEKYRDLLNNIKPINFVDIDEVRDIAAPEDDPVKKVDLEVRNDSISFFMSILPKKESFCFTCTTTRRSRWEKLHQF